MENHRKKIIILRSRTPRRPKLVASAIFCGLAAISFFACASQADNVSTWTSSASSNWSNGANWQGGQPPVVDPNGDDSLEFNGAGTYTANNNLGPFGVFDTTFDSTNGPTTLTGGDINLMWPGSENNNPTFKNLSSNPVTINNNVTIAPNPGVGGTVEYFVMPAGTTTTFNGSMTITGGSGLNMTNGQTSGLGGPGGTMIWTQPVVFTNAQPTGFSNYFAFRIYEGTFEMGGYTIDNGTSDAPVINVSGVNVLQTNGTNNGAITDMYLGPEDRYTSYNPSSGVLLHPNDAAALYLIAGGDSFNQPVQIGDAGTITIGGVNTSGTVTFNDFFKTLPTDGNGIVNGQSQTIYYSAAAGGTVLQNFQLIRGGGSGNCGASVDKIGPGTWIVAGGGTNDGGEQAYVGNTTVRDGSLELAYDDTGTNFVTLPAAAISAGAPYYTSGNDGGSLGYNAATNPVQLGDTGTLPTDNISLLTLTNSGAPGPRLVVHYITVNNFNPNGTTTIGVGDNGTANFQGNILLNKTAILTSGSHGIANFSGNISGVGGITIKGTGIVNLSGTNNYQGITNVTEGSLALANITTTTAANALVADLKAGFNHGLWNGTGTGVINSSTAAASAGITTLGYSYNSTTGIFQITYTLPGDTDLNGIINTTDLSNLNSHIGWDDFNYDGVINADDYSLFMLGAAYGHIPPALAPEPAAAFLLTLALPLFLARGSTRLTRAKRRRKD